MRRFIGFVCTGLVLVLCLAGWLATRDIGSNRIVAKLRSGNSPAPLIDDSLLKTAQRLVATADTPEGQELAREAVRLADHELDQAFAAALRAAASPPGSAVPAAVKSPAARKTDPLKPLTDKIAQIKAQIAAEQAKIEKLTKDAASNDTASDQLELSKAQLALDEDELEDARQDLARQGGDRHGDLERLLQQHEAAAHNAAAPPKVTAPGLPTTLWTQVRTWFVLRDRTNQLIIAQKQAEQNASTLESRHQALESSLVSTPVERTHARILYLSDQSKKLAEFDKRIQDSRQLATVYERWQSLLAARRMGILHLMLGCATWILGIVLAIMLMDRAIHHAFRKQSDRRRERQLRAMARIAIQVAGALCILFVIFGPPSQLSTIIGLATAGITVVLKDFIVSFFGWFVLMGKNGIHVGDWVEIEGVGGEVIEIGLLRTVLLEVGNWTDKGHPTGRRVAFMNSFVMENHYFNFSTSDQWLWDELVVSLPAGMDPYQMAQRILDTVQKETEADAQLAEQDWQRVTHQYATRTFSARPAVDIRPSPTGLGLDVRVRYITRAPQRYEVKSRLFEAVVDLLHKAAQPASNSPGIAGEVNVALG